MKYLYRYERWLGEDYESPAVILRKYRIVRLTPKGVWISDYGTERWVNTDCRKRFAYPTPEEAFVNFEKRTERCAKILRSQLRMAESILKSIKQGTLRKYESSYRLS